MPEYFNCSPVPFIILWIFTGRNKIRGTKITTVLLEFFPKYFNESYLFFSVKYFAIMRENSVAGKV